MRKSKLKYKTNKRRRHRTRKKRKKKGNKGRGITRKALMNAKKLDKFYNSPNLSIRTLKRRRRGVRRRNPKRRQNNTLGIRDLRHKIKNFYVLADDDDPPLDLSHESPFGNQYILVEDIIHFD